MITQVLMSRYNDNNNLEKKTHFQKPNLYPQIHQIMHILLSRDSRSARASQSFSNLDDNNKQISMRKMRRMKINNILLHLKSLMSCVEQLLIFFICLCDTAHFW